MQPERKQGTDLAPVTDMSTGILAVIARAAADPNTDVDKFERLLSMQERVMAREAKANFVRAKADMQAELPEITERGSIKNSGGKVQSTYALWEDINEVIKPILSKHGFTLSFRLKVRDEANLVIGTLEHVDGHFDEGEMALPADTSGSKNNVQAVGSSTSYAKRYITEALLNLTSRGQDDDGRRAGLGALVDDVQVCALQNLANGVGADTTRFCKYFGVKSMNDIPAARFDEAMRALEAKRKGAGK